jgi:hypothetical protein
MMLKLTGQKLNNSSLLCIGNMRNKSVCLRNLLRKCNIRNCFGLLKKLNKINERFGILVSFLELTALTRKSLRPILRITLTSFENIYL